MSQIISHVSNNQLNPYGFSPCNFIKSLQFYLPEQYRPISLCNYAYKILAKLLASRLSSLLPFLISPNQNAFVANRVIQDNISIAHEAYHHLKLKTRGSRHELGLKVDMNKAYDRVEWDFLEALLCKLGFRDHWVRLIMACVSSVSFSVLINGKPGPTFRPSRGLRQGDPLSPYLFLLVSDVFSKNLSKCISGGWIKGIKMAQRSPVLSTTSFLQMTPFFFLRADVTNCRRFMHLLNRYCAASGQLVNHEKSCLYFSSNTPAELKTTIGSILAVEGTDNPGNYLGMPTMWGRSKKAAMNYVKERVKDKILGWKQSSLSLAGKEVLIKAIATAVPTFPMQCFKFTRGLCDEINSEMAKFWWGKPNSDTKIHWKSWSALCLPKSDGGLGFRDLNTFNLALLGKQAWRLIHEPNSYWAKLIKARYFPNCDFINAVAGHRPSWGWISLLEGREVIKENIRHQVFNGHNTKIWQDRWLLPPHQGYVVPLNTVPLNAPQLVSEILDGQTRTWNTQALAQYVSQDTIKLISEVPIGNLHREDIIVWPWNKSGLYSVKSGYNLQVVSASYIGGYNRSSHVIERGVWKDIWASPTLPKVKFFLWRMMVRALPTKLNLYRRRIISSPFCPICNQYEESEEHAIFLCPWTQAVWFGSPLNYRVNPQSITTFDRWFNGLLNSQMFSKSERVWVLSLVSFISWEIWKARCKFLFEDITIDPRSVVDRAASAAEEFDVLRRHAISTRNGAGVFPQPTDIWKPPVNGAIKFNFDAAWKNHEAGLGVVMRNQNKDFCYGFASKRCCNSALNAETEAAIEALRCARLRGYSKIEMESDSKVLIDNIKGNVCTKAWTILPLLDEIRRLSAGFSNVEWRWIPRGANRAAHVTAAIGLRAVCPQGWANQPPPSLVRVLASDGLPSPP
ncbi:PREDICTED: reverse mRNAase [Prunus dulcis]|uniref:PREDICTED: reverse mRNAase n=1 Tax=Prunus dulcis TaxID=3755 RepID=A0A5E4EYF8_PRUDU|nr:PREDICTED: reverse mRNAase [Prunus dulcis]